MPQGTQVNVSSYDGCLGVLGVVGFSGCWEEGGRGIEWARRTLGVLKGAGRDSIDGGSRRSVEGRVDGSCRGAIAMRRFCDEAAVLVAVQPRIADGRSFEAIFGRSYRRALVAVLDVARWTTRASFFVLL